MRKFNEQKTLPVEVEYGLELQTPFVDTEVFLRFLVR